VFSGSSETSCERRVSMTYLEGLRDAIKRLHGCESQHLTTVFVAETSPDGTVRKGAVEVFALISHPTAKRCFAWARDTDDGKRYFAVLDLPPVESAQEAVRAAMVDVARRREGD
jgi:hypothetical protein